MEVGFHGEYRELNGPHRMVWTEMYEGVPDRGPESYPVCTATLDEVDGVTTMMQVSYDRLEDLVRQAA